MTAATAPVATPQKTMRPRFGSSEPPSLSAPMTIEAESAPVTKKIAMRIAVRTVRANTNQSGNDSSPSSVNSTESKSSVGSPSTIEVSCEVVSAAAAARCWIPIAPPPKIVNQSVETIEGTNSTPVTNCRIVRPREMRAMKRPTKGVHEIHHAQ